MTEDTTTGPITTLDIREGYYATDTHGFVSVARGQDDVLFVWGLSCWGPKGEPSTWEYRLYGQPLSYVRQHFPDSRWWPCVDVRPEALAAVAERLREIRRLLAERAAAVMERDRARSDLDDRLVEHLRTDAEHRAEIDRLREQVARLVEGA